MRLNEIVMIDSAALRDLEEERLEQERLCSSLALGIRVDELERVNDVLFRAFNNMSLGLSMFGPDGRLILCNELYEDYYDLPEHLTIPGVTLEEIVSFYVAAETQVRRASDRDSSSWVKDYIEQASSGRSYSRMNYLRDGRVISVSVQPLADGGWVDTHEDVTESVRKEEELTWIANHCALTQVANRSNVRTYLNSSIAELQPGASVAVLLVDLDHFRDVNDSFGAGVGDSILRDFAIRLRDTVRAGDKVGRLGGDEFAIVQANFSSPEQPLILARRIVELAETPFEVDGLSVSLSASVGIALAHDQSLDGDTLLRQADVALDRVKFLERGAVEFYSGHVVPPPQQRMDLDDDLRAAISRNELVLQYQPIVDINSGAIHSCEALMRWNRGGTEMISPDLFIPSAERMGCIVDMGAWALKTACMDAMTWSHACKVAVNISPMHIMKGNVVEDVQAALDASGLPPERLEVEITESMVLKTSERTISALSRLQAMGVQISLDDFGTAFASLSYLIQFSFDKIKIDKTFVRELAAESHCQSIVEAITSLASTLNMSVVIEGVETYAQLDHVHASGCHLVQGHYFSKPAENTQIEQAFDACQATFEEFQMGGLV